MCEDNRHVMTGVIIDVDKNTNVISQYFSKRQCKIRFSDTDFTGKLMERKVKLEFQNDDCEMLNVVKEGYTVQIRYFIDGRDVVKDGKTFNFTALVGYDLVILSNGDDATQEDKNAVITPEGLEYKQEIKATSIDDVIRANLNKFQIEEDPLFGDIGKKDEQKDKQLNFTDLPF